MGSEAAQLLEAADFAAHKHRQQRRKDPEGTPYINHPIGVARILTHEAGITDIVVLQAALLHDTVEDTDTTLDEVELHFGAQVRRLVEEVTDDKTLPKLERKRQQVERAPHSSPGAKLVKLADKLYNLRDLNRCTPTVFFPKVGTESLGHAEAVRSFHHNSSYGRVPKPARKTGESQCCP
ncbi:guanosine-3',5'-bis(diphosphate) 3'-pyrophosphohydrolase MESH1 isoform X3 [Mus pahari]|uniref:guanosine-3',5'-bis(diphosphate) 3'-pyrophosphohydrolase MESH1 isoform X3 n=1 Tax=Mus pahari TaxID=10093 RepID=UPI0011149849|nr:guanosine-3',5'-bis(diphosphate) 3'-pyrophosphohydrolase MESH1 isoform X3 [Mus pahari]